MRLRVLVDVFWLTHHQEREDARDREVTVAQPAMEYC